MEIDIKSLGKKSLLHIDEEEQEAYKTQITDLIKKYSNLPKLTGDPFELSEENKMTPRKDKIKNSLPREDLLKNGPEVEAACFSVPKIMDE